MLVHICCVKAQYIAMHLDITAYVSICILTDVRWNSAGMLGGRALLSAVKQNSALCNLELMGNNIPVDIANSISKST